jgi:hypothetical protein
MTIKTKVYGKNREVTVADKKCPNYECFHPHDCTQKNAYNYESQERWRCLTNFLHGCPTVPKVKEKI